MELFRIFAYVVSPQRTTTDAERLPPDGGAAQVTGEMKGVLEENYRRATFGTQPTVDFVFPDGDRQNPIRDAVMNFGFGDARRARTAADQLATHLSNAMDGRSEQCLFLPIAFRENDKSRVVLWTFPKEDAFQWKREKEANFVNILKNIFSQKSFLRKAAMFEGKEHRAAFLSGRVFDYQGGNSRSEFADFWVVNFLKCTLAIKDEAGTKMIAEAIKASFRTLPADDREKLFIAAMAMRQQTNKRTSMVRFANHYLAGNAKDEFLKQAPNEAARTAIFNFKNDVFDTKLSFRVFRLDSGVWVSAPFEQVGQTVIIEGDDRKTLECSGIIVDEKVKASHG